MKKTKVEARYPEFEEPLFEDAETAVGIASKVKDFVLQKLTEVIKEDCSNSFTC